jgi:PDZ domain
MDFNSTVLNKAIKAVPAVKYALGVAGIVAAVAIVGLLGISYAAAGIGVVVMFVLMTTLVVFARITTVPTAALRIPALVFTWFALLLTMATACLLFSSVFFKKPVDVKEIFEPSEANTMVPDNASTTLGIHVRNLPPPSDLGDADVVRMSLSGSDYLAMLRSSVTEKLRETLSPYGVEVLSFTKGGPGFRAGIQRGDIVSSIDGKPIWNNRQLLSLIEWLRDGQQLRVGIWRGDKPLDVLLVAKSALEIDTSGCSAGDPNACGGLGAIYKLGDGVDKNYQQAEHYFDIACKGDDGPACGEIGVLKNDISLLNKACELENGPSCTVLGDKMMSKDSKKAAGVLSKACSYGEPHGCFELTSVSGVQLSPSDRGSLLRKACWWGEESACNILSPVTYAAEQARQRQMEALRREEHQEGEHEIEHPDVP